MKTVALGKIIRLLLGFEMSCFVHPQSKSKAAKLSRFPVSRFFT